MSDWYIMVAMSVCVCVCVVCVVCVCDLLNPGSVGPAMATTCGCCRCQELVPRTHTGTPLGQARGREREASMCLSCNS